MSGFPVGPFSVVYADPPWSYRNSGGRGVAANHYSTMSLEEIKGLPVGGLVGRDAVLFLWVTMPLLREGLEVVEAWGFRYITCAFTWVKTNSKSGGWFWGMGGWTRSNAEICLLGTRGSPKRVSAGVHSVVSAPMERHSKKPNVVRDKIVELMGDVPRVELFARETAPGWVSWGNEV